MIQAHLKVPTPINEPVKTYAPGSAERTELKAALAKQSSEKLEIPLFIGGKEVRTGKQIEAKSPHRHQQVIAQVHEAGTAEVEKAIAAALDAKPAWAATPLHERAAIFLRAAELLAPKYRPGLNDATLLGPS